MTDYYNDNTALTIPLRPDLSPSKNAQAYFKKYAKAKNALKHLEGLIEESRELIYYLSAQLYYLGAAADAKDADAVVDGLKKSGVIKAKKQRNRKAGKRKSRMFFQAQTATAFMSAKTTGKTTR